jgi:hypothetical protein
MFSQKLNRPIALVAAAVVVGAGAYGIVAAAAGSDSGTATTASSSSSTSGQPIAGGGGSNARSGPAAGGSIGTVASMSRSSFTLTTSAGQRVTVKKVSSTKYKKGTRPTSASAVKKGETVLALGTTNGTSITASQDHRATERQRRLRNLPDRGRPLPARRTVHVKAGGSDPSVLQSGLWDHRQRNESE